MSEKYKTKKRFEFRPFYRWDYFELLGFVNYLQSLHPKLTLILIEDFNEKYGMKKK